MFRAMDPELNVTAWLGTMPLRRCWLRAQVLATLSIITPYQTQEDEEDAKGSERSNLVVCNVFIASGHNFLRNFHSFFAAQTPVASNGFVPTTGNQSSALWFLLAGSSHLNPFLPGQHAISCIKFGVSF